MRLDVTFGYVQTDALCSWEEWGDGEEHPEREGWEGKDYKCNEKGKPEARIDGYWNVGYSGAGKYEKREIRGHVGESWNRL